MTHSGNNERRVLWCVDEDGNELHPTSQCIQFIPPQGWRRIVYLFKFCEKCEHAFDRDYSAAINIGRILEVFMASDEPVNSRPFEFRRTQRRITLNDASEELEDYMDSDYLSNEDHAP